jgi:hypothetical protein
MKKLSKKTLKEIIDDILLKSNSFERFAAFLELTTRFNLKGALYWSTLRKTYSICDDLYSYKSEIKQAFSSNEPYRNTLMSKKELNYLTALPEILTIYRGMTVKEFESGEFGVSWTLKKDVAEFFAYKYRRNFSTGHLPKMVHELKVNKSNIIAYFGERQEYEIIYIPTT